jgi:hypothetical protein
MARIGQTRSGLIEDALGRRRDQPLSAAHAIGRQSRAACRDAATKRNPFIFPPQPPPAPPSPPTPPYKPPAPGPPA